MLCCVARRIVSATMLYDVHSYLFQSFLSHHGGQKIPELK